MKRARIGWARSAAAITVGFLGLFSFAGASAFAQSKSIQIGMAKSFLEEKPKGHVDIATKDFKDVLKQSSGLEGVVNAKLTAAEIADRLDKKELDIGILYAHELAWVRKKHPDLQPILVAVHKRLVDRTYLIVHQKSGAKSIADLKGKKLDLPMGVGATSRLFLDKLCLQSAKKGPADFFASIKKSASQVDALDEVARGKADATVVDTFALEFYKEVKGPVFEKHLQVLQESEAFPPAVIVSKKGALDEATLKQFRDGLGKAHTIALGRDLMKSWNMDAFEAIPKDYDKKLADILNAYPPP